jgi:hypothetical protein
MSTFRMSHRVANSFKIWKGNAYAQRSYGADGMGGQNPPSVIRTAWYMWLVDPIRDDPSTRAVPNRDRCMQRTLEYNRP